MIWVNSCQDYLDITDNFIPHMAETIALREALFWLNQGYIINTNIEVDAKYIVNPFHFANHTWSEFVQIIKGCKTFLSIF